MEYVESVERALTRMDEVLDYLSINVLGKSGAALWAKDRLEHAVFYSMDVPDNRSNVTAVLFIGDAGKNDEAPFLWRVLSYEDGKEDPHDHGDFHPGEEPEVAGMLLSMILSVGILEQVKAYRENRPPIVL